MMSLADIKQKLRKFAEDRNWEQFHSPKNLTMALALNKKKYPVDLSKDNAVKYNRR